MANGQSNGEESTTKKKLDSKSIVESSLIVEVGNQTVQSIMNSSALSNEIVKMVLIKENKTQKDILTALENLRLVQESSHLSIENKMKILKELS